MSLCSVVSVDPLLLFLFRGSHKSPCGMRVALYRRVNPSCAREAEEDFRIKLEGLTNQESTLTCKNQKDPSRMQIWAFGPKLK